MPFPASPKVKFHFQLKPFTLPNRALLKKHIEFLFKKEKVQLGQLSYVFCDDEYLLDINQRNLNHSYYTDIISFRLSEKDEPVNGEIYISIDRVRENARDYKTGFQNELQRVMIHGALHLCGYRDNSKAGKKEMISKENFYLKCFNDECFT